MLQHADGLEQAGLRTAANAMTAYGCVHSAAQATAAELVARYHPMVYRTCRRLLGNDHDAEDAAQAAFLVLARKAGTFRQAGRSNGWLHRVARLTALEVVRKRAARERHQAEYAMGTAIPIADQSEADMEAVLPHVDAALDSLSVVLREAVVLRYLRGFGEKEAAAQAGCPQGTVKWRASEGTARLRVRLVRRGVTVGSVGALTVLLSAESGAAVLPATIASATGKAASLTAAGKLAAGVAARVVSVKVAAWTKGAPSIPRIGR